MNCPDCGTAAQLCTPNPRSSTQFAPFLRCPACGKRLPVVAVTVYITEMEAKELQRRVALHKSLERIGYYATGDTIQDVIAERVLGALEAKAT